jgi:hypothetical protein
MTGSVWRPATFGIALAVGLAALASCGGDPPKKAAPDAVPGAIGNFVVEELIERASAAYGVADALISADGAPATVTIDEAVNQSKESSLGGQMTVVGKVTGTATPAEKIMSLAINATETITDYKFDVSGVTYTVNGAPSVTAIGTFTTSRESSSPATHMTLKGTFTLSRGGVSRTCPVDIDAQANQAGTGLMTGTVCGERVRRQM